MKKYLLIASLFILIIAGCKDEDVNKNFMPFDKVSALQYFEGSDVYSEWYRLLLRSGISRAYHFSSTPMTCFTVRNKALLEYLNARGYQSASEVPVDVAVNLVKYHTIPNKSYNFTSFRDGKLSDSTSTGDYLASRIIINENSNAEVLINQVCKMVRWDVEVVNGIVHELDRVIDPVTYDLYDFLGREEKFMIFKKVVDTTGLKPLLTELNVPGLPIKSRRTFFVTSDSVLSLKGIHTFEQLADRIAKGRKDYTDPTNPLNQFLRYQIMEGDYSTNELAELMERKKIQLNWGGVHNLMSPNNPGYTLPTLAENTVILFRPEEGGSSYVMNNYATPLKFVPGRNNLQVRNGFVHEVNGIMEVDDPSNIFTIVEATDYRAFRQIAEYRNKAIQNTLVNLKQEDYKPFLTWSSLPAEKKDAVAYSVWTRDGAHYGPESSMRMVNGDNLAINLGPVGEITMITRPIPKGTYKIKMFIRVLSKVGGVFQAYWDGEKIGTTISAYSDQGSTFFPTVTKAGEKYDPNSNSITETDIFYIDLPETKSHTFTLKVVKGGELFWDLLLFEPKNF